MLNQQISFALIMGTVGRTTEVAEFLEALSQQTHKRFLFVLVDQNTDDRLASIVAEYSPRIHILHLTSRPGLSKARNVGLAFIGGADVVAFPDDDCIYAPTVLEHVARGFTEHPEWAAMTGRSVTRQGKESNNRWDQDSGRVLLGNVWNRSTSFTIFARSSVLRNIRFDETLGLGAATLWGGAEDYDFVIQLVRAGCFIYFDRSLMVEHPEWTNVGYNSGVYRKARAYARGMGRVLRKHRYPFHAVFYHLIRPVGGGFLALAHGRGPKALWHWSMFVGRAHGWLASLQH